MLSFGLVVEGYDDEAALTELIKKCHPGELDVITRKCRNRVALMQRFPGFLEEFKYVKEGTNVDKAIVIRDADNKNPEQLIATMQAKVSNRRYPFPVKILVAVQELEAWLVSDETAVSVVTGERAVRVQNPESLNDPKGKLEEVLSKAKISYTTEIARRIAANTKVDTVESRCSSFKKFHEAIVDC